MNRTTLFGLIMVTLATPVMAYEPLHALPEAPPIPSDNPLTVEKVALGRQLYFDTRLSFNGKISCNTCHNLKTGGVDHRPLSTGALGKPGRRSTPTVLNAAYQSVQFWDGRAESLEAAVKDHFFDATVMAMPDEQKVVEAVRRMPGYRKQFINAFGTRDAVTLDNIAKAIAGFVRTLVTPDSAFDRYVKGDKRALSEQALRGMEAFKSAGCVACHFGDNFSGPPVPMGEGFYELFPNYLGSEYDQEYNLVTDDLGRYEATNDPIHKRLFHVPTLRNIALTAPYFHTGTVPSLEEAVRVMAVTQLRKELSDRQVEDIVAFLNSLTGRFPSRAHPK
ncbi:MAG: c-type cytochrome [Gammaproteobacteria bacterium]|nr:c-type cytochrome [Gammaproteobacteria bacterium]